MGFLGDAFAVIARTQGLKIISDSERMEAERIGASNAEKIYEPIFERLLSRHEKIEKLSKNKQIRYEEKKESLKKLFIKEQERAEKYKRKCQDKGRNTSWSWKELDCSGASSCFGPTIGIRWVSKEDVPDYKKAIERGFEKTKAIYEKKIKVEEEKIDDLIAKMASFDEQCDEVFEKARKKIAEETTKAEFYKLMAKGID